MDDQLWAQMLFGFISGHEWWTKAAERLYGKQKALNLEAFRDTYHI